ncbi:MAG TPA: NAD(P)H-binding protein [Actinophytocola sp.]|uniref:NAD(P)-dependent oxidoreductase n=1 Tax=Actinophytocola sp. TaxID=1872138 RepID=UPI002DDD0940|nr:NAD(P)H-binding protein [Actinophytocola sp.]HEV2784426.1 NAD(P)H-binding protein [Actinophytocola sp.]
MKVTVFGASGAIGGQVVRQALDAGHAVAAVVRQASRFDLTHPGLSVVRVAGLTDPEPLLPALDGSDAAISAIGPRSRGDAGVASTATRGILRALEIAGVRRFAAVSAVPVGPVPDDDPWFSRKIVYPLIRAVLRDVYADLAAMEAEIGRSATDWTIVRPPRLTNKPLSGAYRTTIGGNVPRGNFVSRADVAHAMLAALDNPATVRQAVGVAN